MEETKEANLVGRADQVLSKIENIATQTEEIVNDLDHNGINIGIGRDGTRLRALPSV